MPKWLWAMVIGAVISLGTPARAQWATSTYAAPGHYAMAYGVPGYGSPRTYTEFSSPYGMGYGYGYAPYGLVPNRYGVGLWRPGIVAPGYIYGAAYYRTIPVPYRPLSTIA